MALRLAQLSVQEIRGVLRRRRKFFLGPLLGVFLMSVLGAVLLPRKFESSTTILVQRDEILNPLVNYTMAVTMVSEDRLKTFNEIVFSLEAVQTLIDSLNLDKDIVGEEERQELVKTIRKNIETERPGSATFRLTYTDSDPVAAQQGVGILARYFMRTVLQVENKRNELAVEFFEGKLEELRGKFEESQGHIVTLLRSRIEQMPVENRTLWGNMQDIDTEMRRIDENLREYQRTLDLLEQIDGGDLSVERTRRALFDVQRRDIPHVAELRSLLLKYDDHSRRYTPKFPEVRKLTGQILDLVAVIKSTLTSELSRLRTERWGVEQRKIVLVEELKRSATYEEIDKDKKSSFDIIRGLYDEMKIKLEQAKTARDLGRQSREQFVLIDPPVVPTEPSKPNRAMIIGGGVALGLLVGVFSAALAELLDPTIRSVHDIYMYKKRVVAFIPDGTIHRPT